MSEDKGCCECCLGSRGTVLPNGFWVRQYVRRCHEGSFSALGGLGEKPLRGGSRRSRLRSTIDCIDLQAREDGVRILLTKFLAWAQGR